MSAAFDELISLTLNDYNPQNEINKVPGWIQTATEKLNSTERAGKKGVVLWCSRGKRKLKMCVCVLHWLIRTQRNTVSFLSDFSPLSRWPTDCQSLCNDIGMPFHKEIMSDNVTPVMRLYLSTNHWLTVATQTLIWPQLCCAAHTRSQRFPSCGLPSWSKRDERICLKTKMVFPSYHLVAIASYAKRSGKDIDEICLQKLTNCHVQFWLNLKLMEPFIWISMPTSAPWGVEKALFQVKAFT